MISDEALFERWVRGDVRAFDSLYERHAKPLFRFLVRSLRDRAEAEDVLHETFMAALKVNPSSLRHSLRAWLYQTARHACLNRARSEDRRSRALDVEGRVSPEPGSPDVVLELAQRSAALHDAVARLPANLSELYSLRASGLSYEEIADVFGLPIGTVKSRMHEVLSRLRGDLTQTTSSPAGPGEKP